ncbi:hypothetical protein ABZS88_34450 [Streptomyces sp. NPDC005480]
MPVLHSDDSVGKLVSRLTLEQKVAQLAGRQGTGTRETSGPWTATAP